MSGLGSLSTASAGDRVPYGEVRIPKKPKKQSKRQKVAAPRVKAEIAPKTVSAKVTWNAKLAKSPGTSRKSVRVVARTPDNYWEQLTGKLTRTKGTYQLSLDNTSQLRLKEAREVVVTATQAHGPRTTGFNRVAFTPLHFRRASKSVAQSRIADSSLSETWEDFASSDWTGDDDCNRVLTMRGGGDVNSALSGCDATGADLHDLSLRNVKVNGGTFAGADLSLADLIDATFTDRTDLTGTNFAGAMLTRATFRNVSLSGTDLRGAFLSQARFEDNFGSMYLSAPDFDIRFSRGAMSIPAGSMQGGHVTVNASLEIPPDLANSGAKVAVVPDPVPNAFLGQYPLALDCTPLGVGARACVSYKDTLQLFREYGDPTVRPYFGDGRTPSPDQFWFWRSTPEWWERCQMERLLDVCFDADYNPDEL